MNSQKLCEHTYVGKFVDHMMTVQHIRVPVLMWALPYQRQLLTPTSYFDVSAAGAYESEFFEPVPFHIELKHRPFVFDLFLL